MECVVPILVPSLVCLFPAGVAEVFDEIKVLLSTIKNNTKTHINEFRSFSLPVYKPTTSLLGLRFMDGWLLR